MKVFISWSGDVSKQVAEALRDWLPNVIQALEPWLSSEDIDKGQNWFNDITKGLLNAQVGIICLTTENLEKPWLYYEAGAISNNLSYSTFVIPFLFNLKPSDLKGPLTHFQATRPDRDDLKKLITTLNKKVEELGERALSQSNLDKSFDMWWSEFESKLEKIKTTIFIPKDISRPVPDMLEEILTKVRALSNQPTLDKSKIIDDVMRYVEKRIGSDMNDRMSNALISQVEDNMKASHVKFGLNKPIDFSPTNTSRGISSATAAQDLPISGIKDKGDS